MSITEATLIIGAVIAVISGLWRGYQAIRAEARAQAQMEARTTQAEATVTQLQQEIARKDRALAHCDQARSELRQLLLSCRQGGS